MLLGVIAYASIPDADGIIHGCYKKSGGTLRVIDDAVGQCDSRAENPVQWNQTGPQGAPGPRGPSDAWWRQGDIEMPNDNAYYVVNTVELPDGSYLLSAEGQAATNANITGNRIISCALRSSGNQVRSVFVYVISQNFLNPYTLTAAVTLTDATNTIDLACRDELGPSVPLTYRVTGTLTAIQVANLH